MRLRQGTFGKTPVPYDHLYSRNQGDPDGSENQPRKASDKELKALKRDIENELKTSRTRVIAAAAQELRDVVQRIANNGMA